MFKEKNQKDLQKLQRLNFLRSRAVTTGYISSTGLRASTAVLEDTGAAESSCPAGRVQFVQPALTVDTSVSKDKDVTLLGHMH